jgi:hypothetical protein
VCLLKDNNNLRAVVGAQQQQQQQLPAAGEGEGEGVVSGLAQAFSRQLCDVQMAACHFQRGTRAVPPGARMAAQVRDTPTAL